MEHIEGYHVHADRPPDANAAPSLVVKRIQKYVDPGTGPGVILGKKQPMRNFFQPGVPKDYFFETHARKILV